MTSAEDVVADLKARLELRGIPYQSDSTSVSVPARRDTAFTVSLRADGDAFIVSFDGWHEHFDSAEEAGRCFALGLCKRCRLRVTRRLGRPCAWMVEWRDGDAWYADTEVGLLLVPWWAKKTTVYLQNDYWEE